MSISPPRPKGPPLNALRAFEAAARLGGFARAAEELCVTPGAVSQHVKALEEWAGSNLFERRSQGIRLTPLGRGVMADFSAAFDRMGEAVQTLRLRAAPNRIRIAALPSVAQLWLSPRLPAIRKTIPNVSISVTALEAPPNLKREPFDMSIFFEDDPVSSGSIDVCQDVIFPVCAPSMAAVLGTPADLSDVTCLHDASWPDDWALWSKSFAGEAEYDTGGPVFSLYSLAVEEARNGAGVLMGHEALVRADLESGALVAPFPDQHVLERSLSITVAGLSVANPTLDTIVKALANAAGKRSSIFRQ